jgi:hypothetical protein
VRLTVSRSPSSVRLLAPSKFDDSAVAFDLALGKTAKHKPKIDKDALAKQLDEITSAIGNKDD